MTEEIPHRLKDGSPELFLSPGACLSSAAKRLPSHRCSSRAFTAKIHQAQASHKHASSHYSCWSPLTAALPGSPQGDVCLQREQHGDLNDAECPKGFYMLSLRTLNTSSRPSTSPGSLKAILQGQGQHRQAHVTMRCLCRQRGGSPSQASPPTGTQTQPTGLRSPSSAPEARALLIMH